MSKEKKKYRQSFKIEGSILTEIDDDDSVLRSAQCKLSVELESMQRKCNSFKITWLNNEEIE